MQGPSAAHWASGECHVPAACARDPGCTHRSRGKVQPTEWNVLSQSEMHSERKGVTAPSDCRMKVDLTLAQLEGDRPSILSHPRGHLSPRAQKGRK